MKLIENFSVKKIEDILKKGCHWDLFITCANSEARCLRSCDIFLNNDVQMDKAIIFSDAKENLQEIGLINLNCAIKKLSEICKVVKHFNLGNPSNPAENIKKFLIFLKNENINITNKTIVVDITVIPTPFFFLLFKVMLEKFGLTKFYITYTEPLNYRPKSEGQEMVLTEGLLGVKAIPGFIGSTINSDDALIAILGFEGKRSIEVFNNINPNLCYAINGFPSFRAGWHKISIESNLRFLKESGAYEHKFNAPANDPFRTKAIISELVQEITKIDPNLDIVIAPLGTKLQAFGVFLYASCNKKIRVVYPFPSYYHLDYSNEYGPTWISKVDLQKLR